MKFALCLQYDGRNYHGWQAQTRLDTIEQNLRQACRHFGVDIAKLSCAGRTDTGVHSLNQIVSLATSARRSQRSWVLGLNRHLPDDIRVRWAVPVRPDFNARASALSRRYLYLINNSLAASALWAQRSCHYPWPLDAPAMQRAAQLLVGEHDFQSFRGRHCQSLTSWRRIDHLSVQRFSTWVSIDISANAFLHHMVRNIVGCLLLVGRGQRDYSWLSSVLQQRQRSAAASTASAEGLYLAQINYPREFGLPEQQADFAFAGIPANS